MRGVVKLSRDFFFFFLGSSLYKDLSHLLPHFAFCRFLLGKITGVRWMSFFGCQLHACFSVCPSGPCRYGMNFVQVFFLLFIFVSSEEVECYYFS